MHKIPKTICKRGNILKNTKKLLCILLSIIVVFSSACLNVWADDKEDKSTTTTTTQKETTTEKEEKSTKEDKTEKEEKTTKSEKEKKKEAEESLKKQKEELQDKLKKSEEKLSQFKESAKTTEEYIDALDTKIGLLEKEIKVIEKEVDVARDKVDALNKQIEPLKKQIDVLQKAYDKAVKKYKKLKKEFDVTYEAYCFRLRAMYISGTDSILAALLTSSDISQFLTRFEMIKAVSKSDTALLKDVTAQMAQITTKQNGLNERKQVLVSAKKKLDKKHKLCKKEKDKIEKDLKLLEEKNRTLNDDRKESDRLFKVFTENAQLYTEFRNEDEELINKVNDEIDDLLSGLKDPDEVTTAVTKDHSEEEDRMESESKSLYSGNDLVLNMCYPAPGHTSVSQGFGHYRNGRAHTGIDYPLPTGSRIVAAQKGVVIKVRKLNYSYGHYVMIYHGTDGSGRQVVTLYAHNSSILVSVGQSVIKGQQIARSGSTGNSTGPHCHFEVIIGGVRKNPANYVS